MNFGSYFNGQVKISKFVSEFRLRIMGKVNLKDCLTLGKSIRSSVPRVIALCMYEPNNGLSIILLFVRAPCSVQV